MNHTLPHPIMMTLLINYINTLLKKEWAELAQIAHQVNFIITFLFSEISIIVMRVVASQQFPTKKLPL